MKIAELMENDVDAGEENKKTEFSASSIDQLIIELQQLRKHHGNIGVAHRTHGGKIDTEWAGGEVVRVHAYGQMRSYVVFD